MTTPPIDESQPIECLSVQEIIYVLAHRCTAVAVAAILPNNKSARASTVLSGHPLLCDGLVHTLQIVSQASLEDILQDPPSEAPDENRAE